MRMQEMCEMKKSKRGVLVKFVLGFTLSLAVVSETAAAEVTEAELKRQEGLALEYRWNIDRTPADDAAAREALYLRLIEECPETEAAERAHWALSKQFVARYPSSRWLLHVTDRLAWLWGEKRP